MCRNITWLVLNVEFAQIQNFTETAKRVSSIDELASEFDAVTRDFGIERYALVSLADFYLPRNKLIGFSRFPAGWDDHYAEKRYYELDPIFQLTPTYELPFTWDSDLVRKGLTKDQIEFFREAKEVGMAFGLSVPVHSVAQPPAVVSVAGSTDDLSPEQIHSVHLMALYLHGAAVRLYKRRHGPAGDSKPTLSVRERECLRWVATGKTNWEIGRILSISENTVHYHIERAKRKLDASTRTQAVVSALFEDHISM